MATQKWDDVKVLGRALREAHMECYPDETTPYEELGCEQSAYDHMARAAMKHWGSKRGHARGGK